MPLDIQMKSVLDAMAAAHAYGALSLDAPLDGSADRADAPHAPTLLDTLDCKAAGNVTTLSLAIPELQLEQMLEMMRQQSRQATKKQALPQGN